MNEATLKYLLHVLDSQKAHAAARPDDLLQKMYYIGMKAAADIVISEGYTQDGFVGVDKRGEHFVTR